MKTFKIIVPLTSLLCLSCLKTVEVLECSEGANCVAISDSDILVGSIDQTVEERVFCSDGTDCVEMRDMDVPEELIDDCESLVDDEFDHSNAFWNNLIQGAYLDSGHLVLPTPEGSMEYPHALSRANLNLKSVVIETLVISPPPLESGVMFMLIARDSDFEATLRIIDDQVCFDTTLYTRVCDQLTSPDSPLWLRLTFTLNEIIGEYRTTNENWNELGRTNDVRPENVDNSLIMLMAGNWRGAPVAAQTRIENYKMCRQSSN